MCILTLFFFFVYSGLKILQGEQQEGEKKSER